MMTRMFEKLISRINLRNRFLESAESVFIGASVNGKPPVSKTGTAGSTPAAPAIFRDGAAIIRFDDQGGGPALWRGVPRPDAQRVRHSAATPMVAAAEVRGAMAARPPAAPANLRQRWLAQVDAEALPGSTRQDEAPHLIMSSWRNRSSV